MAITSVSGSNAALDGLSGSPMTGGVTLAAPDAAQEKDAKESSTSPQFGEVWQQIQTRYGAKPEKQREIKKTLDKDDFLKIMITQMSHQDPTQPFKADQMAAQMAQFASIEQLKNLNGAVERMAGKNQPMERLAMTGMIGKTITVDRERFHHTEGQNDQVGFVLARDAKDVKVSVVNELGETVLERGLGALKKGENGFAWDGKKVNLQPAKTGVYQLRVEAEDEKGQKIPSIAQATTRVIGVSFEGAEPVFLIGDNKKPEKIMMRNVVRIDDSQVAAAPAKGGASVAASSPLTGQATMSVAELPKELQAKIQAAAPVEKPSEGEKGFPNGLKEQQE